LLPPKNSSAIQTTTIGTSSSLRTKISDYLARGVIAVLVIDPDNETVMVHRRLAAPVVLSSGDEFNLEDVVEGFRCPVGEIFG
jgi:Uma2 family endonuclease